MNQKDHSKTVNIAVCAAGLLLCVISGLVCAPEGMLADGRVNLVNALPMQMLVFLYYIPVLLMLSSLLLVIIGRSDIALMASAACGVFLFGAMDLKLIAEHQMFAGILFNMLGIILVAAAVALQVFATEEGPARVTRKAARQRNAKDVPYERHHRPSYDDIYADNDAEFSALNQAEAVVFEETEDIEEALTDGVKNEVKDPDMSDDEILAKLLEVMSVNENETGEVENKEIKEQDDSEDSGLLKSIRDLSADNGSGGITEDSETEADDPDDISETLLSMLEDDEQAVPVENSAMANMAAALETPDPVMADFFSGIEDIFLES